MASGVDAKLLRTTKFPPEFNQKVDMQKVNLQVIKKWIASRISEILGSEDDVVIELCFNLIEGSKFPDVKALQIQLTGFLDKDTAPFCKELWKLCLSAQTSPQGVPKELLEAKKSRPIERQMRHAAVEKTPNDGIPTSTDQGTVTGVIATVGGEVVTRGAVAVATGTMIKECMATAPASVDHGRLLQDTAIRGKGLRSAGPKEIAMYPEIALSTPGNLVVDAQRRAHPQSRLPPRGPHRAAEVRSVVEARAADRPKPISKPLGIIAIAGSRPKQKAHPIFIVPQSIPDQRIKVPKQIPQHVINAPSSIQISQPPSSTPVSSVTPMRYHVVPVHT
ncbi:PWI domain-containing protein [Colletotrichum spinosum]|uniref:PWI domain-containing protein n=1 Tax=Colletotrichum spinosum TaxID=1347390 RepID=A0A4R8PYZ9_9PEZI|nr:PWI domain-containing protein [Colletotrichum spinosum]